jgi:hypothetical protein
VQLQELHDEKFNSIQKQFTERDTRTEQTYKDSKVAVDAALQAAKETVGEQNRSAALSIAKSETSTNKQIDQLGVLITTTVQGLNDKIDDLKERLTRLEGHTAGSKDTSTDWRTVLLPFACLILGAILSLVISNLFHTASSK